MATYKNGEHTQLYSRLLTQLYSHLDKSYGNKVGSKETTGTKKVRSFLKRLGLPAILITGLVIGYTQFFGGEDSDIITEIIDILSLSRIQKRIQKHQMKFLKYWTITCPPIRLTR